MSRIKIKIYILENTTYPLGDNTQKIIKEFRGFSENLYNFEIISDIETYILESEEIKSWDILILHSVSINNDFEKINKIFNKIQNIVLFSNNYELNFKIYARRLNIFVLPYYKGDKDIQMYRNYFLAIMARSYLISKSNKFFKVLSFNDYDNKEIKIFAAEFTTIKILENIEKIAKRDNEVNILFYGPTGTGKNYFAKYFYYCRNKFYNINTSNRLPYKDIDISTINNETALSELFGHEEGAFTGAKKSKNGLIELAQGGVFQVDEIQNSRQIQASFLRLVEERKYKSMGDVKDKVFQGDIVVTTSSNINNNDTFIMDFIGRFDYKIYIKPLRERPKDLRLLIEQFEESKLKPNNKYLEINAKRVLLEQDWPGNARQVSQFFKNCILIDGENITEYDAIEVYKEISL